jgi:hypothetical protein
MNGFSIGLAVAIACAPAASGVHAGQPALGTMSQAVRIAAGELLHRPLGGTPLSHAWTLWQLPEGGYRVDATFSFIYDRGERQPQGHARHFLDEGLRLLSFEYVSLPQRGLPMAGGMCRLEPSRFSCSSGPIRGADPEIGAMVVESEHSADIDGPHDVGGIDGWAMARWARLHPLAVGASGQVRLLAFGRSGGEDTLIEQNATIRRLGPEPIDVLGAGQPAEKYEIELSVEGLSRWHFWLAPDGIPLYAEIPSEGPFPPYRIELVAFERFGTGR